MKLSTFLYELQQQLAQYGLDPREWEILEDEDGSFRVKREEIEMRGTICTETRSWRDLRILH